MGGVNVSRKKRYESVRFNVISVTRGWVGVQFNGDTIRELLGLLVLLQGGTVTANLWRLDVAEHRQPVDVGWSYSAWDGTHLGVKLRINVLDMRTSSPHWHTIFCD